MKLKMKNAEGKEINFFIYWNGTARQIGKKGLIEDFAEEYIRLRDSGYRDVCIGKE